MPVIDIDPALEAAPAYLREYGRRQDALFARTIPTEATEKKNWSSKTVTPATEVFSGASFALTDRGLGHANFLEYLCQCYATHARYVITPDIIWHTILCEIAAEVRRFPDRFAKLFTTTPAEVQEILIPAETPFDFPLDLLMEKLRERVPSNIDNFLPMFTTTDDLALATRYAAFADICSPYYKYGTFACGYRSVDVRGEIADYERIVDNIALLAFDISICGDADVSFWLSQRVMPTMLQLIAAVKAGDGAFFGEILHTERCGSGGEVEVNGWWPEMMYLKSVGGQKPQNVPSHIARVCWTNLETKRRFSLNFGLFYATDEDGTYVPNWGWVRNEIVEAARNLSFDEAGLDTYGNVPFKVETVRVDAKSRVMSRGWSIETGPTEAEPISDEAVDELAKALVREVSADTVLAPYKGKTIFEDVKIITPYTPGSLLLVPTKIRT